MASNLILFRNRRSPLEKEDALKQCLLRILINAAALERQCVHLEQELASLDGVLRELLKSARSPYNQIK